MSYLSTPSGQRSSPWPWGIGLALGGFVILQLSLVRLAATSFEGPDEVQYYKMGLEYSKEVERQQVQRRNGWQIKILQQQPLMCQVLDRQGKPLAGQMKIRFKRPATQSQDQAVQATTQGATFLAPWQGSRGQWLVQINFESQGQHFQRTLRWTMP